MSDTNKGSRLWERATKVIPGGNGLLSKRPDRYAPTVWPTYFSKAKGVEIWDLENNKFIDMAQMGIGTAILGYNNEIVNQAVKHAVDAGVNTTLNAPEEVYLAEKLLELNPAMDQVKFARSGGEAMAIAVRIARARSGKDKVAVSGYHGWSDWYLAANINGDNSLKDHLLPGLSPNGIARGLKDTVYPFQYNQPEQLREVVRNNDIGVIVLEGARYDFPSSDFLKEINAIAKEKNIVVVVDEITSGLRMTDGGVYKLNELDPDIVVYGKALGNGFAISAVVGKKSTMEYAQDTFISSTFWTERVGFVAGLSTLNVLTENKVWEHLIKIGTEIGQGWKMCAENSGLKITTTDFKPLITFNLGYEDKNNALLTLFTQEMLKRGYLATSSVYVSLSHTKEIVEEYLKNVEEVFAIMAASFKNNNIEKVLEIAVREQGFKRIT
jgi:glutamate-1-semialdehyde 2,1-aminomutase